MLIGFALIIVAVFLCCALLFRLSIYALPLFVAGLGSKMGLDATNKWPGETTREWGTPIVMDAGVKKRVDTLWQDLGL